ncbi:hypothetical protein LIER_28469 [Lithospermum erythrorhizon]|uniref:Uncharacterized protein n=1 Tax=Lithospermum erythrorhizon TaxID=34254 RepID=A0AAV3RLS4_LITER
MYPFESLWTNVRILILLPPSEAKPNTCISTAIASTTCRSFSTGVAHPSSKNFNRLLLSPHPLHLDSIVADTHKQPKHVRWGNAGLNLDLVAERL